MRECICIYIICLGEIIYSKILDNSQHATLRQASSHSAPQVYLCLLSAMWRSVRSYTHNTTQCGATQCLAPSSVYILYYIHIYIYSASDLWFCDVDTRCFSVSTIVDYWCGWTAELCINIIKRLTEIPSNTRAVTVILFGFYRLCIYFQLISFGFFFLDFFKLEAPYMLINQIDDFFLLCMLVQSLTL